MSQFRYVKNKLYVEGLSASSIIKNNKTPFYLYSQRQIENNFQSFKKNFRNINPLICFATK
ncbi:MAG: diaminopimelate decarboxylase, partial [Pelagibacteraceae bacterium]